MCILFKVETLITFSMIILNSDSRCISPSSDVGTERVAQAQAIVSYVLLGFSTGMDLEVG